MAQVNRYSRPAQVAKFNPLTAQDIMAIPLMKQEIEDQQIAENREALKELYNTQAVGADQARINERRAELEGRLKSIADDIATNGISRSRTKAFQQLKTDYDKEMSLSGEIGHANAFVAKRDQAKTNFYEWASKAGWDKDKMDQYWERHSAEQSAFAQDGSFNAEYQELGLPKYTDPDLYILSQAKNLGISKKKGPDGTYYTTNSDQISFLLNETRRKFSDPNTPEGRLAQLEGWVDQNGQLTPEFMARIESAGGSLMKYEEDDSFNEKKELMGLKDAKEANKALKEQQAIAQTRQWSISPSLIRKSGLGKTAAETKEQYQEYMEKGNYEAAATLIENEQLFKQEFLKGDTGKNMQAKIDEIESQTPNFFEAAAAAGINPMTLEPTKNGDYRVDTKDGWVTINKGAMDNWKKVNKQFEDAMYNQIGKDKSHLQEKEFVYAGKSGTKVVDDAYKKVQGGLYKVMQAGGEVSYSDINILNEDGTLEKWDETSDHDAVDQKKRMQNVMSSLKPENFKIMSSIPGNGAHNPGFRVQVTIPKGAWDHKEFKNKDRTLEMFVEVDPEQPGTAGYELMTNTLAGVTDDGNILAENNKKHYKYKDFTPSYGDYNDYYNDEKIKNMIPANGLASKFLDKDDKIDLYYDDHSGFSSNKFRIKKQTAEGLTEDLEYSDVLADLGTKRVEVGEFMAKNPAVLAIMKDQFYGEYPNGPGAGEWFYNKLLELKAGSKTIQSGDETLLLDLISN